MDKDYNFSDLLNHWEEDFLLNEDSNMVCPNNRIIISILSYANLYIVYSPSLNTNLELCLN